MEGEGGGREKKKKLTLSLSPEYRYMFTEDNIIDSRPGQNKKRDLVRLVTAVPPLSLFLLASGNQKQKRTHIENQNRKLLEQKTTI